MKMAVKSKHPCFKTRHNVNCDARHCTALCNSSKEARHCTSQHQWQRGTDNTGGVCCTRLPYIRFLNNIICQGIRLGTQLNTAERTRLERGGAATTSSLLRLLFPSVQSCAAERLSAVPSARPVPTASCTWCNSAWQPGHLAPSCVHPAGP